MPALSQVVDLLDAWYPPATADSWDAVGLVCGDPGDDVRRVLLAVDPSPAVAREAVAWGADLLLTHHPLLLKGVHTVAATTPKGRTLTALVRAGCALLTAHTNADVAVGGVSEALADTLGLVDQEPLVPSSSTLPALDKLTALVPVADAPALRTALAAAGAGRIGDYEQASFSVAGQGRFRPLPGAQPTIGEVGTAETVEEERVEVVLERSDRTAVVRALLAAHPYEEPAYDVVELADPGISRAGAGRAGAGRAGVGRAGVGRVGAVPATTLGDLAASLARRLPATVHGVRVGGDPDRMVRRVAVCGGAGDFLLDDVRALGVDAYVTSDLRHHPASEFLEHEGPALVDVAHWAAEWTWLPVVERRLVDALGATVETRVSTVVTDPWTFRA